MAKIRGKKNSMIFNKNGHIHKPIGIFRINGSFIIGVYSGSISRLDIIVRYRQKIDGIWSRVRTPKHIHWAADILIKLNEDRDKTHEFLDFLLDMWKKVTPIKTEEQQIDILDIGILLKDSENMINRYDELSKKGEYSIKFLILLAKLLMIQEKTNLESAFMFENLLKTLRSKGDIFSVVSAASYNGSKNK